MGECEDSGGGSRSYREEIIKEVPAIIQTPFTLDQKEAQPNDRSDQEAESDDDNMAVDPASDQGEEREDNINHDIEEDFEENIKRKDSEYFIADESYIPYTSRNKPRGIRRVKKESKNEPISKHLRHSGNE